MTDPLTAITAGSALLSTAAWLWEQYGKALTDRLLGEAKKEWDRLNWQSASDKYRQRVLDLYGTTRIFGQPRPFRVTCAACIITASVASVRSPSSSISRLKSLACLAFAFCASIRSHS